MKKFCLTALVAMASTAAMAQYTAPTTPRTSQESNAPKSGAMPADNTQMKSDAHKDGTATMGAGAKSSRWSAMDTNGDGMVSQEEYMAYHAARWNKMNKINGKVPLADMEAAMSAGGPN